MMIKTMSLPTITGNVTPICSMQNSMATMSQSRIPNRTQVSKHQKADMGLKQLQNVVEAKVTHNSKRKQNLEAGRGAAESTL